MKLATITGRKSRLHAEGERSNSIRLHVFANGCESGQSYFKLKYWATRHVGTLLERRVRGI